MTDKADSCNEPDNQESSETRKALLIESMAQVIGRKCTSQTKMACKEIVERMLACGGLDKVLVKMRQEGKTRISQQKKGRADKKSLAEEKLQASKLKKAERETAALERKMDRECKASSKQNRANERSAESAARAEVIFAKIVTRMLTTCKKHVLRVRFNVMRYGKLKMLLTMVAEKSDVINLRSAFQS